MDALQYTNWAVEVADRVEAIVTKRMNGYPDPETTPTLELLNAIDARLAAVEAERDALRDHSLELYGLLLTVQEYLRGDLPEASAEQFITMIDMRTSEPTGGDV